MTQELLHGTLLSGVEHLTETNFYHLHTCNNRLTDNFLGPDGTDNKQHLSTLTLNTKNSSSNAIPCRLQWDL